MKRLSEYTSKTGRFVDEAREAERADKEFMVKFEKNDGGVKVRSYMGKSTLDVESKARVDAKRMGAKVASVRLKEEVEELDELSKELLARYAKSATVDARMKHGIGKDFEYHAKKSRKPEYKAGAKEWENKYKSDARRRQAGVHKAIDRLAKEEVEQIDEVSAEVAKRVAQARDRSAVANKLTPTQSRRLGMKDKGGEPDLNAAKALKSAMKRGAKNVYNEEVELDEASTAERKERNESINNVHKGFYDKASKSKLKKVSKIGSDTYFIKSRSIYDPHESHFKTASGKYGSAMHSSEGGVPSHQEIHKDIKDHNPHLSKDEVKSAADVVHAHMSKHRLGEEVELDEAMRHEIAGQVARFIGNKIDPVHGDIMHAHGKEAYRQAAYHIRKTVNDIKDAVSSLHDRLHKQLRTGGLATEEVEVDEGMKPYVSSVSPKLGEKGSYDVMDKEGKVVKSYPHSKEGMKAAQSHLKKMKEETQLAESHFKIGDEVVCKASGMEGEVVKIDEPQVGKYYTVKREDGKMMKYAPNELEAEDEDEMEESDMSWAKSKEMEKEKRLNPSDRDKLAKIRQMISREKSMKSMKKESVKPDVEKHFPASGVRKHPPYRNPGLEKLAADKKKMKEELVGNQHKIDANKDGKITSHDFKKLRKGKKETATINPSLDKKSSYEQKESTIRQRLLSVLEKKDPHTAGATPPESWDNKYSGGGAKKMRDDNKDDGRYRDLEKNSHDDASKAGRAGPNAKSRPNDNMKGDKKIINPVVDVTKVGKGSSEVKESLINNAVAYLKK